MQQRKCDQSFHYISVNEPQVTRGEATQSAAMQGEGTLGKAMQGEEKQGDVMQRVAMQGMTVKKGRKRKRCQSTDDGEDRKSDSVLVQEAK